MEKTRLFHSMYSPFDRFLCLSSQGRPLLSKYSYRDVGFETRRRRDIPVVPVVLEIQEPQSSTVSRVIMVKRRKWCGVEKTECWKVRDIYIPPPRISSSLFYYLGDAAR